MRRLWLWLNHHDLCPCGLASRVHHTLGLRLGEAWCERVDLWAVR